MRATTATTFGVAVLSLAALPTYAADWTGKGEAGLVIASGNTETRTANAKLALATEIDRWKHQFGGAALYASSDPDGTTARRWEAFEQTDYNFNARNFVFGAARYENDEFSGFEYQAIVSGGIGHKFIDTESRISSAPRASATSSSRRRTYSTRRRVC
jgi:putative salt-induced outer membrane protein